MLKQTKQEKTLLSLLVKSNYFHPHLTRNQAQDLLSQREENCLFTHGRNDKEIVAYYRIQVNNKNEIRSLTFYYNQKHDFLYTANQPLQAIYRLSDAADYIKVMITDIASFNPVLLPSLEKDTEKMTKIERKLEQKINEILERKQLVQNIINHLFPKLKSNLSIKRNDEKTQLNLASANGASFNACKQYAENQYFIDIRIAEHFEITDLFFDGKYLEIGGFQGKKLSLNLLKVLNDNIQELTQDYSFTDYIQDINQGLKMK